MYYECVTTKLQAIYKKQTNSFLFISFQNVVKKKNFHGIPIHFIHFIIL